VILAYDKGGINIDVFHQQNRIDLLISTLRTTCFNFD
jgi:hypothetical protein